MRTSPCPDTGQYGIHVRRFLLGEVRSTDNGIPLVNDGKSLEGYRRFYVQDDWKARRNLTLNFGLRWDIPTAITEVRQRQSGLDPTMPNPGADGYPGAMVMLGDCQGCNGKGRFADPYYKQFAPRVGFAWTPGNSNKMVIRGGYGINFAPPIEDFGWTTVIGQDSMAPTRSLPANSNSRFLEDPSYSWDNPFKAVHRATARLGSCADEWRYIAWYNPT